jgi:hypothetical protein
MNTTSNSSPVSSRREKLMEEYESLRSFVNKYSSMCLSFDHPINKQMNDAYYEMRQIQQKLNVIDFQFPMSNPVKITKTKTENQKVEEFVDPEDTYGYEECALGPAPAGVRCDGSERRTKNPAIGAGYSQTNTVYLQEDMMPSGPPLRREEVSQYSPIPVLCKSGDYGWLGWIQLIDGLYEYIGKDVPPEEHEKFINERRNALIEKLKAKQEEKANAGTGYDDLTEQAVYTADGTIEIRPPPVRRTEEYPGYRCDSYEAVSMENTPGITINKNTK